MTHTPGPWKIVRIDGELVGSIYGGKTRICAGIIDDMKLRREAEANAALISAAPEMLEILENLVGILEEAAQSDMDDDGVEQVSYNVVCLALSKVYDVLRKARGESCQS